MQEVKRETTFCGKVAEKIKIFFCFRTDNQKSPKITETKRNASRNDIRNGIGNALRSYNLLIYNIKSKIYSDKKERLTERFRKRFRERCLIYWKYVFLWIKRVRF
jgi:hypothetical protein